MLGNQGQHEVQAIVVCNAHDDVRFGNAFLLQQVQVRAVAADSNAVIHFFRRQQAPFPVFVENLDLHALLVQHGGEKTPRPASADDDGPLYPLRIALDEIDAEFLNRPGIADKVSIVMRQELVVAVRDNHAVIPENHADQYGRRNFQILKGNID